MSQELHRLTVIGVRQQSDHDAPLVVLEDELGRTLEIFIAVCEASAIHLALHNTVVGRPLTHELLLTLADHLETPVDRVIIDDVSHGIFYARLVLNTPDGLVNLDCRPSDGITIALRAHVPILASETVMHGDVEE